MKTSLLRLAFENVAPHIVNLEYIKGLVVELEGANLKINHCIEILTDKLSTGETTKRTDIRILISELKHLKTRMQSE